MWLMFNQAKTWSTRPSELVGITGDYLAFCFDEAVASWGNFVTNELEKIEGKTDKEVSRKRHGKLMQLLDAPDSQRFASLRKSRKGKKP
jgi:hypothetical protein